MNTRRRLILFAKAPRPGQVKTRLIGNLGVSASTKLYEQLLNRTIAKVERASLNERVILAAGESDACYFRHLKDWAIAIQQGKDIGQRMATAFRTWSENEVALTLIGADVADFEVADLEQTYRLLESGFDVVLGPSYDGGYWLIASRLAELPVFHGIDWSTGRVFSQTRLRLQRSGLSYSCLPIRHDIDESQDLRFVTELAGG